MARVARIRFSGPEIFDHRLPQAKRVRAERLPTKLLWHGMWSCPGEDNEMLKPSDVVSKDLQPNSAEDPWGPCFGNLPFAIANVLESCQMAYP